MPPSEHQVATAATAPLRTNSRMEFLSYLNGKGVNWDAAISA